MNPPHEHAVLIPLAGRTAAPSRRRSGQARTSPPVPATPSHGDRRQTQVADPGPNDYVTWLAQASLPPTTAGGSAIEKAQMVIRMARQIPQMVIVSEEVAPASTARPLAALERFDGRYLAALRARIGASLPHRLRVFVLTHRYGLVGANEPIRPGMAWQRAPERLTSLIRPELHSYLELCPVDELLLLLPSYLLDVLPRVTGHVGAVHTIVDQDGGWPRAARLLDRWGWP